MISPGRINVFHVDDEEENLHLFRQVIAVFPEVNYIRGFNSSETCYAFLQQYDQPYLLFADIEMPGQNGLELAGQLKDSKANIVFLTNHAEYTDAAFEASALHYITKPITSGVIKATLERLRLQNMKINSLLGEQVADLYRQIARHEPPKRLFIPMIERMDVVMLDSLIYVTSRANNYSEFVIKGAARIISSKTIKTYEEVLAQHPDFVRIHKSHIINKVFLRAVSRNQRSIKAVMENGDELEISYQRKDEIMELLMV